MVALGKISLPTFGLSRYMHTVLVLFAFHCRGHVRSHFDLAQTGAQALQEHVHTLWRSLNPPKQTYIL
jgi:hypothetical protein